MKKTVSSVKRTFSTLLYVVRTAWGFNKFFLVSRFVLAAITGIMPTISVLFSKLIVEQITNKDWKMTVVYIAVSFAVSLFGTVCVLLIYRWQGASDSLFRNDLFFQVLVKNSKLDLALLDSPEISTKKQMATTSAQGNYISALFSSFFNLISGMITLLSVTYILSKVDIYIFLIMFAVIVLQSFLSRQTTRETGRDLPRRLR